MKIVKQVVHIIDRISEWSGRIFCLIIIPLVAGTAYDVFMRYALRSPTKWAYEVTWMEYGALFVLGGAYTLKHHGHIRVDIFFNRLSPRGRAIFDTLVYLVIFFPLSYVLIKYGIQFAHHAWEIHECSYLSYWQPPVYPIKTILPLGFLLLAIQGVSEFIRNFTFAVRGKEL